MVDVGDGGGEDNIGEVVSRELVLMDKCGGVVGIEASTSGKCEEDSVRDECGRVGDESKESGEGVVVGEELGAAEGCEVWYGN